MTFTTLDKAFAIKDLLREAEKKQGRLLKAHNQYLAWEEVIQELKALYMNLNAEHQQKIEDAKHDITIKKYGSRESSQ